MSGAQTKPGFPRWAFYAVVVVVLLTLLAISRWMFLAAHSLFLVVLYRRSGNRGLLIAAAIMMGLAVGILVEGLIDSPERVTSLGGVALALAGLHIIRWKVTDLPGWASMAVCVAMLALTPFLWAASEEVLQLYLKAFPAGLVTLFLLAAVQYWRDLRSQKAAAQA